VDQHGVSILDLRIVLLIYSRLVYNYITNLEIKVSCERIKIKFLWAVSADSVLNMFLFILSYSVLNFIGL
jgi:hypothetical protein